METENQDMEKRLADTITATYPSFAFPHDADSMKRLSRSLPGEKVKKAVLEDGSGKRYFFKPTTVHKALGCIAASNLAKVVGRPIPLHRIGFYGKLFGTFRNWVEGKTLSEEGKRVVALARPDLLDIQKQQCFNYLVSFPDLWMRNIIRGNNGKLYYIDYEGETFNLYGEDDFLIDPELTPSVYTFNSYQIIYRSIASGRLFEYATWEELEGDVAKIAGISDSKLEEFVGPYIDASLQKLDAKRPPWKLRYSGPELMKAIKSRRDSIEKTIRTLYERLEDERKKAIKKGAIGTDAFTDGKKNPAILSTSFMDSMEQETMLVPKIQEFEPEVIESCVKVELSAVLSSPRVLRGESDDQIGSIHLRLHQLWDLANAGRLRLTRPEFLKVHALVVAEMERRGIDHNAHDELDQASLRSKTRKFMGEQSPYNVDYYNGLSDIDRLFASDFARVSEQFPEVALENVLEIGCGTGRALKVLKASGIEAQGVEVSDHAVSVCRNAGLEASFGDAADLPYKEGAFDVTFSMDVLEHVQDFQKALNEAVRVAARKSIHLIPLGIRRDATHRHTFKTLDDLRKVVLDAVPGQAIEFHRTTSNKAVVVIDKDRTDTSPVTAYLQDFTIIPGFMSLVGGTVKRSDPRDIDIVWRVSEPIRGMELAFRNLLPPEVHEKVHHIYNPFGPHDDHIELFDLVAVKRPAFRVEQVAKAALKPLKAFTPLKTGSGYTQHEFFTPDAFWEMWAKPFIEEGTRLAVEIKYNGYRTVAQSDGKGTLVYFEDSKNDRSEQLVPIVNDLKAIGKPVILDMDLGATYEDGTVVPRVELSGLISENTKVAEDGTFTTPSGKKAWIVGRVFHILYLGDEDLHTLPWEEMRKRLSQLFAGHDFKHLKISRARLVSSKGDLMDAIKKASAEQGSEGAVVKVVTTDYPLDGKTTGWAKIKNLLELKVEVIDRKPVKDSPKTYNYFVGYTDESGKLREMGKTFNTNVDAKPGDILTLSAEEVIPRYDEDAKTWTVTTVVPRVEDLETGSMKAEGVRSIIERAYKANVLQASPDVLDRLRADKVVSKGLDIELFDVLVKAEGTLSFQEGDEGTGILQTHERGLEEFQVKLTHDFGWDPVMFTPAQLDRLSEMAGKNIAPAYKEAQDGRSGNLSDALKGADPESLSKPDQELLALARPVSIHTDFRMRPGKEDYWEGGEGFTPGNQFQGNKFRLMAEGKLPPGSKILMNFKTAREDELSDVSKAEVPVRGPLAWMGIGRGSPKAFPPGSVGSTSGAWSRFFIRDQFDWKAGVQDKHYKEFEFNGSVLDGRWIFQFVPVGMGGPAQAQGRAWMVSKPAKQIFDSEALNKRLAVILPILKRNEEQRIVTAVVLKPDATDAQGDIISPPVIEKAAYNFLLNYRRGNTVGYMHRDMGRNLQVVESYIAPSPLTISGRLIPEGSWVMSVKVFDDEIWKRVLAGEVTGFSIGGMAKVSKLPASS